MLQKKQSIAFSGHKREWDLFRLICKLQDTDASKILRSYINEYNSMHLETVVEYEEEKARREAEERIDNQDIVDDIEYEIERLKKEFEIDD